MATRRRWMEMLRRTASAVDAAGGRASRGALDDAALWGAHDGATQSIERSAALAERVAAATTRQSGRIDGAMERFDLLLGRSENVTHTAARAGEAFERLGVVALNAGLEGARAGEAQGRALLLLSDEIRANVARGAEASEALAETTAQLVAEAAGIRKELERARAEVGEVVEEAAKLRASAHGAAKSLGELGERLRAFTGTDPEFARVVVAAAEHARGLMAALSTLSAAGPAEPVRAAVGPLLEPLSRMLRELSDSPSGSPPDPSSGGGAV